MNKNKFLLFGFLSGFLLFLLIEGLVILFIEDLGLFGIGLSWLLLVPIKVVLPNLSLINLYFGSSVLYGLIGLIISFLILKFKN